MSLQQITEALQSYPELALLDFHGLNLLIRYASLARKDIDFAQVNQLDRPAFLPPPVVRLLATALGEKDTRWIEACWSAFGGLVWSQPLVSPTNDEILAFNNASLCHQTSFRHLYPPVHSARGPDGIILESKIP
ncbi:hypothetical protein B0H17DRAFT_953092 [Mycena rosella]|uniref:Uncharacterized protein n=1 Tax=Mycena rosella TaxID=1033263 RepID=A0AAD7CTC1_MYCRO|nr:hypothetical protein B0H17DRAFT_953092 [Mycena rosella]